MMVKEREKKGCNAIKDNKKAQAHSDRCRVRLEECLKQKDWIEGMRSDQ